MTLVVAVGTLPPENQSVLFDFVIPHLRHNQVAAIPGSANVGLMLGLPGVVSVLPLLLLLGGGAGWFARVTAVSRPSAESTVEARVRLSA
jgi:hypothetical protein